MSDTEIMENHVTDEDCEKWEAERERQRKEELRPYIETRNQISEHDEMFADLMYEMTMMELGEETE